MTELSNSLEDVKEALSKVICNPAEEPDQKNKNLPETEKSTNGNDQATEKCDRKNFFRHYETIIFAIDYLGK